MWLLGEASLACMYPDPLPGGCPADEVRARERFDFWFGPVLLVGPIVMLGVWAWFSPQGHRHKPVWWLLAAVLFCVAPGMLLDAASAGAVAVDRTAAPAGLAHLVADVKLVCGAVAVIGAPAGLAYLAYRRGRRAHMKIWTACSIAAAASVVATSLFIAV